MNFISRNFNTISPSAKWILLMKGHSNIPFARQTAELILYPEKFQPDYNRKDITYWARTVHFESRYWSIDNLLDEIPVSNILELSSGYSFRGLEAVRQKDVYYIDSDLPDIIAEKTDLLAVLKNGDSPIVGKLELLPLNALDEMQFQKTVDRFPVGPIVVVNEGLMMYLDINEKEKLCRIIHTILKNRGGYWITADIYLKNKNKELNLKVDDNTQQFYEQHKIEDNKFESFIEAEAFFNKMGFVIEKEAKVNASKLSTLKYLMKSLTLRQLFKFRKAGKIQKSWRLRLADTQD